jgi:hypothetical protein
VRVGQRVEVAVDREVERAPAVEIERARTHEAQRHVAEAQRGERVALRNEVDLDLAALPLGSHRQLAARHAAQLECLTTRVGTSPREGIHARLDVAERVEAEVLREGFRG